MQVSDYEPVSLPRVFGGRTHSEGVDQRNAIISVTLFT